MKSLVLLFVLIVLYQTNFAQQNKSLLIWQEINKDTSLLLSYHFGNTIYIDTLLTETKNNTIFTNYGSHTYRNNYIFTSWGDFFNIKKNKFIDIYGGDIGICIEKNGDSIIYRNNYITEKLQYYCYNLETEIFDTITDPIRFRVEGKLSPDKTKGLTYNWKTNEITLHRVEGDTILGSCFTRQNIEHHIDIEGFPLFWLDNNHFLTQISNGEIVKVNLQGDIEPALTIKGVGKSSDAIKIYQDINGKIIYYYNKKEYGGKQVYYSINIENKTYKRYNTQSVYDQYGFTVRKKKYYSLFLKQNGPEYRRCVIKVRNNETGKVFKIKSKNTCVILGWIVND